MPPKKQSFKATGFYVAAGLIAYAALGAFINDLYLPGRRTSGVHLHFEALPPAVLGITLFALTFVLEHFKPSRVREWTDRALRLGAVVAMAFAFHAVVRPSGKAQATLEECRATFVRLEEITRGLSSDGALARILQERARECPGSPILKSFHDCVQRARMPSDVNRCQDLSEALFGRKNAS